MMKAGTIGRKRIFIIMTVLMTASLLALAATGCSLTPKTVVTNPPDLPPDLVERVVNGEVDLASLPEDVRQYIEQKGIDIEQFLKENGIDISQFVEQNDIVENTERFVDEAGNAIDQMKQDAGTAIDQITDQAGNAVDEAKGVVDDIMNW